MPRPTLAPPESAPTGLDGKEQSEVPPPPECSVCPVRRRRCRGKCKPPASPVPAATEAISTIRAKGADGFSSSTFWANKLSSPDIRYVNKVLNKIKRSILEKTSMQAEDVVINRKTRKIFKVDGTVPIEVATVDVKGSIFWHADVQSELRMHTQQYLS